jgi:hypothetical protein
MTATQASIPDITAIVAMTMVPTNGSHGLVGFEGSADIGKILAGGLRKRHILPEIT